MKTLITFEEIALFLLGIYLFSLLQWEWCWFPALLLVPDISMLGYTINNKVGAWLYNVFHHRAIAIAIYIGGVYCTNEIAQLVGVMLFSHASMDRIFGYGLKYEKGFKFTHLGEIGNK